MSPSEEVIGWMAAFGGMIAMGSFGVPIKGDASNSVNIDPLVFQSYKSGMVFLTCWIPYLVSSQIKFDFTFWGIVSCIFWVPGGVATVFAIRNAGLAIAIGVGSSTIVLVSFIWGIFIFEEKIHSKFYATIAIIMMMIGLLGMSYYSSPVTIIQAAEAAAAAHTIHNDENENDDDRTSFVTMLSQDNNNDNDDDVAEFPSTTQQDGSRRRHPSNHSLTTNNVDDREGVNLQSISDNDHKERGVESMMKISTKTDDDAAAAAAIHSTARTEICDSLTCSSPPEEFQQEYTQPQQHHHHHHLQHEQVLQEELELLYVCGIPFTRRQIGIAGALFNGIWGGSIMAPMKWCNTETSGVGYLISFGIGAAVVTTALWIIRFVANVCYYRGSLTLAYRSLPSFHFKVMWCAGGTSGLLWSIGNFFSLISVNYLGEGVGYSVIQAGMLVSGLWGIFYFHEVSGKEIITKWFASASITICGIILLSYEHHKK